MNFFKGTDRVKGLLDKARQKWSKTRYAEPSESAVEASEPKKKPFQFTYEDMMARIALHKWTIAKSASALVFIGAVVWSGNQYVHANMVDFYHVYVNGQEIGVISDTEKVRQFAEEKKKQLSKGPNDIRMVVEAPAIEFKAERAFMAEPQDAAALAELEGFFTAHPVGTQLLVDGKPMGIVRDTSVAQAMLDQIKTNAVDSMQKKKESGKVSILSATAAASTPVETELLKTDFVQKVELKEVAIEPTELVDPEELRKKLETGDVQPTKYTVEQGDCVSCIAKKLEIPKQVIYQNNPWITNDMIKVGQQLDLTVLQPTLAVRTVEKIVENEEIAYETEYQQDDSMRLGTTQVLSPGKNGLKKVTIELTKVNGLMEEEKVLDEQIIEEPVKAVAKKGTKVVKGEGTGKFAWPVVSASISSTFGTRWGAFHKGVDLTGNRNIMASDNGKVIFAGVKDGYGNCIILDHLNGYKTLYGHLSQINTSVGKIVEKGEKIGYTGSTGDSTGIHLHFEVQKNGSPDNPLKYLNR